MIISPSRNSIRLADLLALVAGFALAFAGWSNQPDPTLMRALGSAPGYADLVRRGIEMVLLAPVVLAPVVVAQRMKRRDLPRAGEWLLIVMAASRVTACLQRTIVPYYWSLFERIYTQGGFASSYVWWSLEGLATFFLCLGILVTAAFRTRLSAASITLGVSVLIFLAIAGPVSWLGGEFGPWLWALYGGYGQGESPYLYSAIRGASTVPLSLLFAIPIVAILRDLRNTRARTATEKTGVILALVTASIWLMDVLLTIVIQILPTYGGIAALASLLGLMIQGLGPVVSLAVAARLVARFGEDWNRLRTPRPAAAIPPEMAMGDAHRLW